MNRRPSMCGLMFYFSLSAMCSIPGRVLKSSWAEKSSLSLREGPNLENCSGSHHYNAKYGWALVSGSHGQLANMKISLAPQNKILGMHEALVLTSSDSSVFSFFILFWQRVKIKYKIVVVGLSLIFFSSVYLIYDLPLWSCFNGQNLYWPLKETFLTGLLFFFRICLLFILVLPSSEKVLVTDISFLKMMAKQQSQPNELGLRPDSSTY